jgi:hypothetical protein
VGAQNPIEEVHHLGRIEQGIEAVVGPQLQEPAELLSRSVAVALKKLGNSEHAMGLNDLALRLQADLGVEQGPQDLDGPAVLTTVKGGLATPKLVGCRRWNSLGRGLEKQENDDSRAHVTGPTARLLAAILPR